MEKKDAPKTEAPRGDEDEAIDVDAEDDEMPIGGLETKAEFEEMIIWGHETTAEASQDPYVRSVEEWMQLSEQVRIHVFPSAIYISIHCGYKFRLTVLICRYMHTTRARGSEKFELELLLLLVLKSSITNIDP